MLTHLRDTVMSSQRAGNSSVPVAVAGARVSRSKQSHQKKFFLYLFHGTSQNQNKSTVYYLGNSACGGGGGWRIQKKRNIPQYLLSLACAMVLGGMGRDGINGWDRSFFFLRCLRHIR